MTDVVRTMSLAGTAPEEHEALLLREWLVTNGIGGYASGTIGGAATRRYHGLLIAALPAPLGRMLMLNCLSELLRLPDGTTALLGRGARAALAVARRGLLEGVPARARLAGVAL
jgi:hypothetical protein